MVRFNDVEKKHFLISDLFNIKSGGDKPKVFNGSIDVASVENMTRNNGVKEIVKLNDDNSCIFKNFISVVSIGGGGHSFYHKYNACVFTRVKALIPKYNFLNEYIGIYLTSLINCEKFKYSYGRVVTNEKVGNIKLPLPVNTDGEPDWQFMEDYIKQFDEAKLLEIQKTDYKENVKLPDVKEWGSFLYSDLFDLKRGSMAKKPEKSGSTPYVSSSGMNNAWTGMYEVDDKHIIQKSLLPLITVANNGSVGSSFIQELPFSASSDVSLLLPKFPASKEMLVFIKIIIEESKDLYSYGRKWGLEKMRSSELKLPVLADGSPDFNLIERYIKSLPYSEMI